jgi:DNA primase
VSHLQERDSPLEIFSEAAQAQYAEAASEFSRYLNHKNFAAVKEYAMSRGLSEQDLADAKMGFCPPYHNHWFPLLRGRLIVPICDSYGRYIAFAGRRFEPLADMTHRALRELYRGDDTRIQERIQSWDGAKWINEVYKKKRHLYNLENAKSWIEKRGYAILMEGYMDVRVSASLQLPNACALCGTTVSEIHAQLLRRYTDRVALMLDGDAAGAKAIETGRKTLEAAGIQVLGIHLTPGKDPDEFVRAGNPKLIHQAIKSAFTGGHSDLDFD